MKISESFCQKGCFDSCVIFIVVLRRKLYVMTHRIVFYELVVDFNQKVFNATTEYIIMRGGFGNEVNCNISFRRVHPPMIEAWGV